jgi:hypothetical protein
MRLLKLQSLLKQTKQIVAKMKKKTKFKIKLQMTMRQMSLKRQKMLKSPQKTMKSMIKKTPKNQVMIQKIELKIL